MKLRLAILTAIVLGALAGLGISWAREADACRAQCRDRGAVGGELVRGVCECGVQQTGER